MIFKKYGQTYQSVEIAFDARAMTEIAFRRDREDSIPTEEFDSSYTHVESRSLAAQTSGSVQDAAEVELLKKLEASLREFEAELGPDEVIVIESEQGVDYPKTHDTKTTVSDGIENRLHFSWRVDPPLRVGRYKKGS